jgi:outer membrane autotransporter protein
VFLAYPDVTVGVARTVDSEVQSAVEDARQRAISAMRGSVATGSGAPLGFAPDSDFDATFAALGYAPVMTKAPPPPASTGVVTTFFGTGTYAYEHQTGFAQGINLANDMRAWGGLGGVDYTIPVSPTSSVVIGFLGGQTDAHISLPAGLSTAIRAPTAGGYIAFVNGSFSTDLMYTRSWYSSDGAALIPGVPLSTATSSDITAGNAQYNFNLDNGWYVQPTAGFTWTRLAESFGLADIEIMRLQAGAIVGTSFTQGGVTIQPSLTGLAYSDVSYTGGNAVGAPPIPSDERQLWGKAIAKINVIWSKSFSTYAQGEIHGTSGTENIFGYVATAGFHYSW